MEKEQKKSEMKKKSLSILWAALVALALLAINLVTLVVVCGGFSKMMPFQHWALVLITVSIVVEMALCRHAFKLSLAMSVIISSLLALFYSLITTAYIVYMTIAVGVLGFMMPLIYGAAEGLAGEIALMSLAPVAIFAYAMAIVGLMALAFYLAGGAEKRKKYRPVLAIVGLIISTIIATALFIILPNVYGKLVS